MKQIFFRTFIFIFLFVTSLVQPAFAQKKYQGLLWEITGNGLTAPSYLYGTMHVSNKLAFNVSDSFYICLNAVKSVALESAPDTWMDDYRDMGSFGGGNNFGYYYKGFYDQAFAISRPQKQEIYELLENKNGLMNQILYRFSPGAEDYQEDTYLDMFIYQAGAKSNKPIYSLEEAEEVYNLSILAMMPEEDNERDNDNNAYLEENDYGYKRFEMMQEAYRTGDLDRIDSLSKAGSRTKTYHHYFIVERNKNMVNRMDSLMRIHSVFTGIGAAHLPGDEGAIELLRDKGYTVRAVSTKSTGRAHKMRNKLTEQYRQITFSPVTTGDAAITVSVPGKLYEMPTGIRGKMEYLAPEPINGGYFSVIRLFTFGPLFNKTPEHFMSSFDSLIYIATPGEIISKSNITLDGNPGYQILSKTSKNAIVCYKVFFTPTEIVIFKGTGNGEYIQRPEPQAFFSKIAFAPKNTAWNDVAPKSGNASWKMKGTVTFQDRIEGMDNMIPALYQSYDPATGDYYLAMEYRDNDMRYIEEDSFDLAYLGKSFAAGIGYDIKESKQGYSGKHLFIEQELTKDEDHPELREKVTIRNFTNGGAYYLLLTTGDGQEAKTFFESFQLNRYKETKPYETYTDSSLFYSVSTIVKEERFDTEASRRLVKEQYLKLRAEEEDESHMFERRNKTHVHPVTGESITVEYRKFNSYDAADTLEAFWEYQIEVQMDEHTQRISNKKATSDGDNEMITFTLTDTGSTKGIYMMMYVQQGVLYSLRTLIDTTEELSEYVSTFYETFKPLDTLIGRSLFEDKADLFFAHVNGTDSLDRVNAVKSITQITFEEKDVDNLIKFYNTYEYDKKTENETRENIIYAFAEIEDQKAFDFLEKVYNDNSFNSTLQFAVLGSLAWTEDQRAANLIKKLLLTNAAVTDDLEKMDFFWSLYDSLELTTTFFPEMLDLSSYPEYKSKIVELLATGYLDSIYNVSHFVAEKKMIMRDATIELKRTLSDQEKDEEEYGYGNYYYSNYNYNTSMYGDDYHVMLLDYYALMCGLKKNNPDPMLTTFFEGIEKVRDKQFILETQIINHRLGLAVDTAKINSVITDPEFVVWSHKRMEKWEMLDYYTPVVSQEDFTYGYLYAKGLDKEKDSVVFLRKVYVNNGKDTGYVYFYKRKKENLRNWMIDYVGVQPSDSTLVQPYLQLTKLGLSFKNEDQLEETIEKSLERFMLRHRQRVAGGFNSYDWEGLEGLFEY